jgi:hypothetical protein
MRYFIECEEVGSQVKASAFVNGRFVWSKKFRAPEGADVEDLSEKLFLEWVDNLQKSVNESLRKRRIERLLDKLEASADREEARKILGYSL